MVRFSSTTSFDRVDPRIELQQKYGTNAADATRNVLAAKTAITSGKDTIIKIDVEDTDPKLAEYAHPERLVTTEWLAERLDAPDSGRVRLGSNLSVAYFDQMRTAPVSAADWCMAQNIASTPAKTSTSTSTPRPIR